MQSPEEFTHPYQADPATSLTFNYTYDDGVADSWYEQIGRMTGLALSGGDPIIHYATTGGGRNITQQWGDGKVKLDYNSDGANPNPSVLHRFGRIKTMDIRKMTGPTESTPIHKYEYAYDANFVRSPASRARAASQSALKPSTPSAPALMAIADGSPSRNGTMNDRLAGYYTPILWCRFPGRNA